MNKSDVTFWINLKTKNFNEITNVVEIAFEYSLMYVIIGFSGAGKTTAFDNLRSIHSEIIYMRLDKSFRPKDFYVKLLRLAGVLDYGYDLPLRFLAEKLARTLNNREGKSLILIDDAGRLNVEMCEYFQQIRDETSEKVGIILAGTRKFKTEFDDWVIRDVKGMPELGTRIMDWIILPKPSPEELKTVAQKNGVTDSRDLDEVVDKCSNFRTLCNRIIKLRIRKLKAIEK